MKKTNNKINKKIGLKLKDGVCNKEWAYTVEQFFIGYKQNKDTIFKPYTKEEEDNLYIQYKDNRPEYENQLITHNIFLAINIAGKYSVYNKNYQDILSSAMYGLQVAARKYDPTRGTKFSTCATWWIRKYILQATTSNKYNKRITLNTTIYIDSPEFTEEHDDVNYNYNTFINLIEPVYASMYTDIETPYEKLSKEEISNERLNLINQITKSISTSSLSNIDKDIYHKLFVDKLDIDETSKLLGITKQSISHSRHRIAKYISSNFSMQNISV